MGVHTLKLNTVFLWVFLKLLTLKKVIMSKHKIIFCSSEIDHESEMECYLNSDNEIVIIMSEPNEYDRFISLDKATAIKFSKVLRTEISKIQ